MMTMFGGRDGCAATRRLKPAAASAPTIASADRSRVTLFMSRDGLRRDVREAGLRALVHDGEIALHAVDADHVGIRIAGLARLERGQLDLRSVEDRVIRNQHIGAGLQGDVLEAAR